MRTTMALMPTPTMRTTATRGAQKEAQAKWATAGDERWDDAASWRQNSPRRIQRRTRIHSRSRRLHCSAIRAHTAETPTGATMAKTSSRPRSRSDSLRWTAPAAVEDFGTATSAFAAVVAAVVAAEAVPVGRAAEAVECDTEFANSAVAEPTVAAIAGGNDAAAAGAGAVDGAAAIETAI